MLEGPLLALLYLICFGISIIMLYLFGYIIYKIYIHCKNKKVSRNNNHEPLLIENNII